MSTTKKIRFLIANMLFGITIEIPFYVLVI